VLEIPQYIINWGLLVITAIASWFARQLWDAVQKLKSELSQLQLKIAEDYLPKKEFNGAFKEMKDEIRDNFKRLFEVLDGKADKH